MNFIASSTLYPCSGSFTGSFGRTPWQTQLNVWSNTRHDFVERFMGKYTLNVNGATRSVEVESDTPLLWVLRDSLELTGTKFGCGIAQCGACTVHVNGVPTRSCRTSVSTVGSAAVTTIEGIDTPQARALQDAWCELDVPQCGYCQGGQILAAAALLKSKPHPTDADIDAAMARNVCRCASYTRIREGIKRAAELAATATPANGKRE